MDFICNVAGIPACELQEASASSFLKFPSVRGTKSHPACTCPPTDSWESLLISVVSMAMERLFPVFWYGEYLFATAEQTADHNLFCLSANS